MKNPTVAIGRPLMCAIREAVTGKRWFLTDQLAPGVVRIGASRDKVTHLKPIDNNPSAGHSP